MGPIPGTKGPKSVRDSGSVEAEIMPMVRPWKLLRGRVEAQLEPKAIEENLGD